MKAMRMFPSLFLSRTIKNMKIYYMVKKARKIGYVLWQLTENL
jgi:hypothetical protein